MPRQMRLSSTQRAARRKVKIIIIALFLCTVFIIGQQRLTALTVQMAESRARNIAQTVINQAIEEELEKNSISYDDLIILEKGTQGQITALKSNIAENNRIKSQITQNIIRRLNEIPPSQLSIPVGNLINSSLFSNVGPSIPIQLLPIGSVSATFTHDFSSAGINQTRHQIIFVAAVTVTILVPGRSVTGVVQGEMTIAETIIVGSVPGSYTFFDSGTPSAALN